MQFVNMDDKAGGTRQKQGTDVSCAPTGKKQARASGETGEKMHERLAPLLP